ncbi:hypothetical protein KY328_05410 [Candidatus Woesearchaeota archaeon]|nr:hypothetical protein [Candidatus Woesearchaeota archaeon]MBW3022335.1 hypothetical protein [Candidatus Woesearchaeota archaeon]
MKNRKSQIKMAENIGILVIFFVLVVVGLVFYTRVQQQSVKFEAFEKVGQDALLTSKRIANMPEIQCSKPLVSDSGEQDCIDIYRLNAFTDQEGLIFRIGEPAFNSYYYDIFGYSNVTVKQIYPASRRVCRPVLTHEVTGMPETRTIADEECETVEAPEWNVYTNVPEAFNRRLSNPTPVLLYDEVNERYSFGLLIVEVFS